MKRTASCADAQQLAERLMIGEFSRELGRTLGAKTIPIGATTRVQLDGFHKDESQVTPVEVWAHIGKAKPAQRNEVLSDMLKLVLVSSVLRGAYAGLKVESSLLFADIAAANVVNGNGWPSVAAKEFEVEARVIVPSADVVNAIKDAQKKQDIRTIHGCDDSEM